MELPSTLLTAAGLCLDSSLWTTSVLATSFKDMMFAEVTDATGLGLAYKIGKFDGILGMAFPILSVNKVPTMFESMVQQGLVDKAEFSSTLVRRVARRVSSLLGGTNPDYYTGDFQYVPFKAQTYREITMDSLKVGDSTFGESNNAIVDSEPSAHWLPDWVKAIAKAIGAKLLVAGEYVVSCDATNLPDFDFTSTARSTPSPRPTT